MNKSYLFLIGLLIILAIAVGGFALYRSTTYKPVVQTNSPINNVTPTVQTPTKPPPPTITEEEQIAKNNTLPLTISSPLDKSEVATPTISVSGTTAPNADVSVNDKDLKANSTGKFTTTITLDDGQNYILIVASNETGASEWQGTITYTPAE